MKSIASSLAALLLIPVLLTGCGSKAADQAVQKEAVKTAETPVQKADFPLLVNDFAKRQIKFDSAPTKIATLSSGDLDIINKLGGTIVGRPTSKAPVAAELQNAEQIGDPHQPNIEKIASVHPDLLIASSGFEKYIPTLESQGIQVFISSANSIQEIRNNIELYGNILGKADKAKEIVKNIDDQIAAIQKEALPSINALLVYGAPGSYLVALPNSLSGDLLSKTSAKNIAADFEATKEYPQYAPLSVERIVEKNPSAVFLITHGDPAAVQKAFEEEMAKNAAWKNLDAVKNKRIVVLPSDLFGSNPGTRVSESLAYLQNALKTLGK